MRYGAVCFVCGSIYTTSRNGGGNRICCACWPVHTKAQRNALSAVGRAVASGQLPKPSELKCVDCGGPAKQYDHRDYTNPLFVAPVCISCNWRRGPVMVAA